MNFIKVKRDPDGMLLEECKDNIGVKIGSFDCTANCPHNQNSKKEIQTEAFDLKVVKCLKNQINQLKIDI